LEAGVGVGVGVGGGAVTAFTFKVAVLPDRAKLESPE
jgi:hypothetical protein